MENNVKIVERYKPKKFSYRIGEVYKDFSEIIDVVYILNIDGKDGFHEYATKEEAEQAALKYNTQEFLKELQNKANEKIKELDRFRQRLSYLNKVYITWKSVRINKGTNYIGKDIVDIFNEENPVISLLAPQERHKCYIALMKEKLKKRISEYYKIKKEYLNIKKKIKNYKTKFST